MLTTEGTQTQRAQKDKPCLPVLLLGIIHQQTLAQQALALLSTETSETWIRVLSSFEKWRFYRQVMREVCEPTVQDHCKHISVSSLWQQAHVFLTQYVLITMHVALLCFFYIYIIICWNRCLCCPKLVMLWWSVTNQKVQNVKYELGDSSFYLYILLTFIQPFFKFKFVLYRSPPQLG